MLSYLCFMSHLLPEVSGMVMLHKGVCVLLSVVVLCIRMQVRPAQYIVTDFIFLEFFFFLQLSRDCVNAYITFDNHNV
uniref:Secreted protein n=1 Tax=Rhizophora mucronata TaxID=61149 RepID=A0A2P2PPW3_RHIMU